MFGSIYKITNCINGKIYIGQTIKTVQRRFQEHIKGALANNPRYKNIKFYSAIRKYGPENFIVECIDLAESRDELNKKEIYWISKLKSQDRKLGYNIRDGGFTIPKDINKGRKVVHSEETKRKISLAKMGKAFSEEHKKHLSEHHRLKTNHILIFKDGHFETSNESVEKLAKRLSTNAIRLRRASEVGSFRCGNFYLLDLENFDNAFQHKYRYSKEKVIYDEIKKDIVSPTTIRARNQHNQKLYENVNLWNFIPQVLKEKEQYIKQRQQIIQEATNEIGTNY